MVVFADELHAPVLVAVAAGGVGGVAVDEVVGERDEAVGVVAKDIVNTADERCLISTHEAHSEGKV